MTERRRLRLSSLILLLAFYPASLRVVYAQFVDAVVYEPSVAIQIAAEAYQGKSLAIDDFLPQRYSDRLVLTNRLELKCFRDAMPIDSGDRSDVAKFVRDAMTRELFDLGAIDSQASIRVSGNLSSITGTIVGAGDETEAGIEQGTWSFTLALRSSLGRSSTFAVTHRFGISSPERRCQDMTEQFVPGVQLLLTTILGSEEFLKLISS